MAITLVELKHYQVDWTMTGSVAIPAENEAQARWIFGHYHAAEALAKERNTLDIEEVILLPTEGDGS